MTQESQRGIHLTETNKGDSYMVSTQEFRGRRKEERNSKPISSPLDVCIVNKLRSHIIIQCGRADEGGDWYHDLRVIFCF